jgi:hypothetical protein
LYVMTSLSLLLPLSPSLFLSLYQVISIYISLLPNKLPICLPTYLLTIKSLLLALLCIYHIIMRRYDMKSGNT